jgi:hypothetical protein
MTRPHPLRWPNARPSGQMVRRLQMFAALVFATCIAAVTFGASRAAADIGDLGPPPTQPEVAGALTDLYNRGKPLGSDVGVVFAGPIQVGQPTPHDVPGGAWCFTCAEYAKVNTPTYPVFALVRVTVRYDVESSAVSPDSESSYTTTFAGANCVAGRDCAYHFYRDEQGNWLVA